MIKEKEKCSVCGNNNRESKSIFCKPCRKQIADNIIVLLAKQEQGEELTGGTPAIRAASRRLYEKHYHELERFQS